MCTAISADVEGAGIGILVKGRGCLSLISDQLSLNSDQLSVISYQLSVIYLGRIGVGQIYLGRSPRFLLLVSVFTALEESLLQINGKKVIIRRSE
ncbi:MAG: hypothetical protein DRR08_14420 [Candidatus Parabeggiatoa sp. nov. 2]|nr:MAG: hypothetical protein DRR08_14420 [Gammaproteobacteria bacterium]HEC86109.1 hypothetical protein [Thioploca sp.]